MNSPKPDAAAAPAATAPRTLYRKLWDSHVIAEVPSGEGEAESRAALIHVDRHLLHECSTHQSFEALRVNERKVHRRETHLAVPDHAVSTSLDRLETIDTGNAAGAQVERLASNVAEFDIPYVPLDDARQGIVHVMGPELGFTLPGTTLACGDSHTSTHGAFGALAFGIGASDCETVLATNAIVQQRADTVKVELSGAMGPFVTAKDVALALIGKYGAGFATGCAVEFTGEAVRAMSMAARMTLCNMAIEAGARIGLVAPDETTIEYLRGLPLAPSPALFAQAADYWRTLPSDPGALYDRTVSLDLDGLAPQVTWGTNPQDAAPVDGTVPAAPVEAEAARQHAKALAYMGLETGMAIEQIGVDVVFIGSCTNGRIEDLRAAADVARGRRVAQGVRALVVPGSMAVRQQAEAEGLDAVFTEAGFEWRMAGCSMCVAMNDDRLGEGQRSASTSNRNFEGRQGRGGRTHLMSPAMAAAAAVTGHVTDVRKLEEVPA
ncbi:3-isopropylmalate dehydratase large subunit [Novosphingobium sp. YJ-S2-02]|uniref:3-isopropylmalate dehydratase large subunit n=1 Tax=Novosphingobium aureum TaxID=2792964 RepID=A0A931HDS5_9SPHN|nr:3-isopropylmalate dehydratase large subunit [Novosphingobium aureum]MBH0114245.1 3-isopropylmalate dehydratase large subunit [Novosphingobium aureum]